MDTLNKIGEQFHKIVLKLMDMVFWKSLIAHFHWVDWITVAFLVLGIVYGARKGLMRELVELLEMVIVVVATFIFYPMVSSTLSLYVNFISQRSMAPVAFISTALCTWFVIAVIDKYMQKWVHSKLPAVLRVVGGVLVGVTQFLLIWSFLSQAIILMPLRGAHKMYEPGSSATGQQVKDFAPAVFEAISNPGKFFPKKA